MQGQALDNSEILSIRWAHDDPNPVAQDSISRADRDALTGLLTAKGISTTAAPFEYPSDYQVPDSKRLRLENGADVASEHPDLAYPDTDQQYASGANAAAIAAQYNMTPEQYAAYCEAYYAQYVTTDATATATGSGSDEGTATKQDSASNSSSGGKIADTGALSSYLTDLLKPSATANSTTEQVSTVSAEGVLPVGWAEFTDDDTGATYYYHAESGQSSWELPTA